MLWIKRFFYVLLIIITGTSCGAQSNKFVKKSLPLQKGDFWVDSFSNLSISRPTIVYNDSKLYCNTIEISSGLQNYFYCFDLNTGKVLWANKVSGHATFNPIILNDIIYYVTYVGDRYAFDTLGNELWHRNFGNSPDVSLSPTYHSFNPINHNLILNGVFGGFYEFDKRTGNKIHYTSISGCNQDKMSQPVFIDKYIYFVNECYDSGKINNSEIPHNSITCQNYFTQEIIWSKPIKASIMQTKFETLHAKFGNVYIYGSDSLFSLNGKTGAINWKLPIGKIGGVSFTSDRILGSHLIGIDYESGKIIPYLINTQTYKYLIADSLNNWNCYKNMDKKLSCYFVM